VLGLDPEERMQHALDNHQPFGGVTLNWPVDGGYLPVELAGEPQRQDGQFAGYHGSGACRDLAAIERLECCGGTNFPSPRRCRSRFLR